jgi:hypothetical protein
MQRTESAALSIGIFHRIARVRKFIYLRQLMHVIEYGRWMVYIFLWAFSQGNKSAI